MRQILLTLLIMTLVTACSTPPAIQPNHASIVSTSDSPVRMFMYKYQGPNPLSHHEDWQMIQSLPPIVSNVWHVDFEPGETLIIMASTDPENDPSPFHLLVSQGSDTLINKVSSRNVLEKGPSSQYYEAAIGYHTF